MSKKYYYILLLLLPMLSCRKDAGGISSFTKDSYPLAVGNWWQYQQSYCFGGADTIMMRVVSMTNLGSSIDYKCYVQISSGLGFDSGHFVQSESSLYYYSYGDADFSPIPNFHLEFPFLLGQKWPGLYSGDTIRAEGEADSCGGFGRPYGPCYATYEAYLLPHRHMVNDMFLTPKIGLVYGEINLQSDTEGIQVCQSVYLINYHLQ
jgi:hypothetical protein